MKFSEITNKTERDKFTKLGIIFGYLHKIVALLVNIVSLPICLSILGASIFPIWLTIIGLVQFVGISDLGFGLGFQNCVSEAIERNDQKRLTDLLFSGLIMYLIVSVAVGFVCLGIVYSGAFGIILGYSVNSVPPEIRSACYFAIPFASLSFFSTFVVRVLTAFQSSFAISIGSTISSILMLFVYLLCRIHGASLAFLIIVGVSIPILGSLLSLVINTHVLLLFSRVLSGKFSPQAIYISIKLGSQFIIPQLCLASFASLINPIVLARFGAPSLLSFGIIQKLCFALLNVLQIPLNPLWPAYRSAYHQKDISWIRSRLSLSLWYSLISGVCVCILIIIGGRYILWIWLNKHIEAPVFIYIGFGFWLLLMSLMTAFAMFTNALNFLGGQSIGMIIGCCCLFVLLSILPATLGYGVVICIALTVYSLCLFVGIYFDYRRALRSLNSPWAE